MMMLLIVICFKDLNKSKGFLSNFSLEYTLGMFHSFKQEMGYVRVPCSLTLTGIFRWNKE